MQRTHGSRADSNQTEHCCPKSSMGCLCSKLHDNSDSLDYASPEPLTNVEASSSAPVSDTDTGTRPTTFVAGDDVEPEAVQAQLSPISTGSTYDAGLPREGTDQTPSPESHANVEENDNCKTLKKLNAASLRNADASAAGMSAVFRAALRNAPQNRASDLVEDAEESNGTDRTDPDVPDGDVDYYNLGGNGDSRRASEDTSGQCVNVTSNSDNPVPAKKLGLITQEFSAKSRRSQATDDIEGATYYSPQISGFRSKSYDDALDKAGINHPDTSETTERQDGAGNEDGDKPLQPQKVLGGLAPQFRLSVALAKEFKGKLGLPTTKKVYLPPAERAQQRKSQRPMPHKDNAPEATIETPPAAHEQCDPHSQAEAESEVFSPGVVVRCLEDDTQADYSGMSGSTADENSEEPEYEYAHELIPNVADNHDAIAAKVRTLSAKEVDHEVATWEEEGIQEYIDSTSYRPSLRHAKNRHLSSMSTEEIDALVSSWEREGKEILRSSIAPGS